MEKILDYLQRYWKSDAFRPLQQEVIEHYLKGKDSVVLMPTGGGKSICYQLPALLDQGQTLSYLSTGFSDARSGQSTQPTWYQIDVFESLSVKMIFIVNWKMPVTGISN